MYVKQVEKLEFHVQGYTLHTQSERAQQNYYRHQQPQNSFVHFKTTINL